MTRVLFRADKTGKFKGTVTAVFIDEIYSKHRPDTRMCYEHIGQHSSCDLNWVRLDTRPAKSGEYSALLRELTELVGYDDLVILNRLPKEQGR